MSAGNVHFTPFVRAGHPLEPHITSKDACILQAGRDWKIDVDLGKKVYVSPRHSGYNTLTRHGPQQPSWHMLWN